MADGPQETAPLTVEALRATINARLEELRPLVEEYNKLENAHDALEAAEAPAKRRGRPPGVKNK